MLIAVVAIVLVALIVTAGKLVLGGSPGLALLPVAVVLIGIFFYVRKAT